ncbi:MAG: hypothetical protein HZB47_09435 [Nitrosomonadales bacterium]|nr:hypothetical protein [Nitrosomonadales bacterium]
MSRISPSMIASRLPWFVIGLFILLQALGFVMDNLNYSKGSQLPSPDGKKTIHEFRSNQDGVGHAPYGTTLSLSFGKTLAQPDDGYVFFAGYCKTPVSYAWLSNDKVVVSCELAEGEKAPRTLARLTYGIEIGFDAK